MSKSKKEVKFDNKITNHFKAINKLDPNKVSNPYKCNTGIELPARMLFCGPSGSAKNNTILEYLKRTPNTFDELHCCAKNSDQPFYHYLRKHIPEENLFIYEVGEIPSVDDFEPNMNRLFIFDDYANDKQAQKKIIDWYIRGRHVKASCAMLVQSFHRGCDKVIRQQCDYIFILKVNSSRDLKLILSEFPLEIEYKELLQLYNKYTKLKGDFLLIDLIANNIRHNFLDIVYENPEC